MNHGWGFCHAGYDPDAFFPRPYLSLRGTVICVEEIFTDIFYEPALPGGSTRHVEEPLRVRSENLQSVKELRSSPASGSEGFEKPRRGEGQRQLSFDFLKTLSILQPDAPLRNFSLPKNSIIPPGP
jgi:hypothetical protein